MEREKSKKKPDGWFLIAGFGFVAVLLGAFGTHILQNKLTPHLFDVFRTAVSYQFYHIFAMGFALWLAETRLENSLFKKAVWFFGLGIFFFSGSLYAYIFSQSVFFAKVTPIGGVLFLFGWLCIFFGSLSKRQ